MYIRRIFTIALTSIAIYSTAQEGYELRGTTGPQLEGKTVYLTNRYTNYSKMEQNINDSVVVTHGRFFFSGRLNNPAGLVTIYTKTDPGVKQFFLENRKIGFDVHPTGKKNLFDSVVLSNAVVNQQYDRLQQLKTGFYNRMRLFQERTQDFAKANDSLKAAWLNESRLMQKEETDIIIGYMKAHPDDYISFYWFAYHVVDRTISNPERTLSLFRLLNPSFQETAEGKAVMQAINNKIATAQNKPLPSFTIPDMKGNAVSSSQFRNRYLLIDFWASWCGPCIEEIPHVKKLNAVYGDKNLSVISISLDNNKDQWLAAVKKHSLPWTQVSELKGWDSGFAKQLDIRYIPQYFLVGPDGKFVLSGVSLKEVDEYLSKIN